MYGISNLFFLILVGTLLTILIRHGDLPGIIQKLGAFYIIYDLFHNGDNIETPFMLFFASYLDQKDSSTKINIIERNFISHLLTKGTREVLRVKKKKKLVDKI